MVLCLFELVEALLRFLTVTNIKEVCKTNVSRILVER